MEILKIDNLCKKYPTFSLKNASFSINSEEIMDFISHNGAGKTTGLKPIMNLIHYDSHTICTFGKDMKKYENENNQCIDFSLNKLNYYPNKTIKELMRITKRFYKNFSDEKFNEACRIFNLDLNKKLEQLSSGMKVKFSVAIALSHEAELLILDEPTSGLDPISRDEVLDIFKSIVKNGERAILFSTHITSDLDKCATDIAFIHNGIIYYSGTKDNLINSYKYISLQDIPNDLKRNFIAFKDENNLCEGLIKSEDANDFSQAGITVKEPDLEQIMVYLERSMDKNEEFTL